MATYADGLVAVDEAYSHADLRRVPRFTDPSDQVAAGSLLAPMPASVVSVAVAEGRHVETGQPILVLEAMKMQHTVQRADAASSRAAGRARPQVEAGAVLAVVDSGRRQPMSSEIAFTETDERQALRTAVADLGRQFGRDYFLRSARRGEHDHRAVGRRPASSATSASPCRRSTAAAAATSATSRRCARSWPPRAARC